MGFVSNQELVDVREMVADIRADSKESLQKVHAVLVGNKRILPPIDKLAINERVAKWRQSGSTVNLIEKNREICRLKAGRIIRGKVQCDMKVLVHEKIKTLMTDEIRIDKNFRDFDLYFKHNIQQAKSAVEKADYFTKKRRAYQIPIEQLTSSNISIKAQLVHLENDFNLLSWLRFFVKTVRVNKGHNGRRQSIHNVRKSVMERNVRAELDGITGKDVIDALLELEDQNLKIIEHILLDGESLQEAINSRNIAQKRGKRDIYHLKQQMDLIKMNITRTNEKSADFEFYCSMFNSGLRDDFNDEVDEVQRRLEELEKQVRSVFCFINPDMNELDVNPVTMLSSIESRVYELVEQIDQMDPIVLERKQRDIDREKRLAATKQTEHSLELRKAQRQAIKNERNQSSQKVKVSRPLMQRSRPPIKQKKEDENTAIDEFEQAKAQLAKTDFFHFFCDFVLGEEEGRKQYDTGSSPIESPVESVFDHAESDTSL